MPLCQVLSEMCLCVYSRQNQSYTRQKTAQKCDKHLAICTLISVCIILDLCICIIPVKCRAPSGNYFLFICVSVSILGTQSFRKQDEFSEMIVSQTFHSSCYREVGRKEENEPSLWGASSCSKKAILRLYRMRNQGPVF